MIWPSVYFSHSTVLFKSGNVDGADECLQKISAISFANQSGMSTKVLNPPTCHLAKRRGNLYSSAVYDRRFSLTP